jgi:hypothetical protein
VTDPLGDAASILDAIITAFYYNGFVDLTDPSDTMIAGWDSDPAEGDPGGYIYSIAPQESSYNIEYYEGSNGHTWGHAWGEEWNIAYTVGGALAPADVYGSNIELADGMEIVFDWAPFDRNWDTGLIWPNLPD